MANSRPILIYHAIFAFAVVFDAVSWWDALLTQNIIQAGSLVLFNLMLVAYTIIQYFQHKGLMDGMTDSTMDHFITESKPLEFALIAAVSTVSVILIALAYPIHNLFSWGFYERLGADVQIRRLNLNYLFLMTLLKLDFFFFISYTVSMVTLVLTHHRLGDTLRIAITLPLSIIIIALGFFGVMRENKPASLAFFVGLVLGIAYLIFEVIFKTLQMGQLDDPYVNSRPFLYFFEAVLLILILLTLGYGIRCYRNYNRGLREAHRQSIRIPAHMAQAGEQGFGSDSGRRRLLNRPQFQDIRPLSNVEID
ncbi:hypothetical protein SYNPS1DRAFT_17303 [Syncephalis pseudoplumigaleata]|uniref:Uncharacterized protein n=2 Tax=Zoopagomycota TaxID=1913638 RepID=A0A4P9ZZN2_9FUNG|nr:hypothetical protein SYNPS1DRAFT_17303 [Syncephalis pseudoplumigaleata]RKP39195.1 hypothetical protein BJ085DRAFT_19341 [Dimargaris cristalligena]|eukprot:RKP24378.1 hypothetical protein SYNPS1DRAFT_17303 [Syncephalis pseudoplumigaleata]